NPTVPEAPELEAIIFRALEKDRTKRFATAREFADAIEKILPSLSDMPGAAPIPIALEVTDDATHAAPRKADIPTVANQPLARTMRTDSGVAETVITASEPTPKKPRSRLAAVAVVLIIVIGGGVATMLRNRPTTMQ